jgi:hypothetical protein
MSWLNIGKLDDGDSLYCQQMKYVNLYEKILSLIGMDQE